MGGEDKACQKIIQQRLRLLGGVIGTSSARTPTPTTAGVRAGNLDHRVANYQDVNHLNNVYGNNKAYHHLRSVSAIPGGQEHCSESSRRNGAIFQASSSPAPNTNHGYQRDSATLIGPKGGERSLSTFATPSLPLSHMNKLQRSSAAFDYIAPSPAHSSNSFASTANGTLSPNYIQHSGSRTSSNLHSSQLDQAEFLKDEVFDNHIPAQPSSSTSHIPTPSSTPTAQRKNRRISNLFQRPKDIHHEEKVQRAILDTNMGMGRAIPVKQGHLYKRSSKTLNKEWKKKYVCLHSNGRLSYHQTLKDYMEKDSSGKEVYLGLATVRVSGRQRPRVTQRSQTQPISSSRELESVKENANKRESLDSASARRNGGMMATYDCNAGEQITPGEGTSGGSDDQQIPQHLAVGTSGPSAHASLPNSAVIPKKKKGHRRLGSGIKNHEEEEDCEFEVVTCDQKRWEFSATSVEERDEWVSAIEDLIQKSLQAQTSQKQQINGRAHGDRAEVQALRELPGNDECADCGEPKPDWASLNLGTLICIECSGIHRNLGSHISRVRSLDLDAWPVEYITVMDAIGNRKANSVWEFNAPSFGKPTPNSSREDKESWIKMKYEAKRFLPPIVVDKPLGKQLLEAVFNNDLVALLPILPRCGETEMRTTVDVTDKRTALHIACSNASAACTQLLVWYNADTRILDHVGRSALWYAQTAGANDCVSILVNAGADPLLGNVNSGNCITNGSSTNNSTASNSGTGTSTNTSVCTTSASIVPTMIAGSLAAREYCTEQDLMYKNEAKLRRQSDVVHRAAGHHFQQQQHIKANNVNGFHRGSDAFERLPASVI
uniref:PH domain-containing protein n=1 Tax=Syphacia muris TaxID=451379 RepID=A0A0N5ANW4_9BILA